MKKSPENFRDNLAKTLKLIPDHGARRAVHKTLRETPIRIGWRVTPTRRRARLTVASKARKN